MRSTYTGGPLTGITGVLAAALVVLAEVGLLLLSDFFPSPVLDGADLENLSVSFLAESAGFLLPFPAGFEPVGR